MRHKLTPGGKTMVAFFAMYQYRHCPLRGQCPTEQRGGLRALRFTRADVALARRRVEQETPAFKERYKLRSGIEATNSELRRCHGLGKPSWIVSHELALDEALDAYKHFDARDKGWTGHSPSRAGQRPGSQSKKPLARKEWDMANGKW